jgi:phosphate transport system ATP-binding protein
MGVGIQVNKLNAWFGKTQALYDITMEAPANHATAVIGPSGCGKSTFVRCLNRMHETVPEARATGRVQIGELDVYNGTSAVQIRRRIGMVFQKPNPFPTMSIYDNVAAGLKLNGFHDHKRLDEIVERSLKLSALWDEVKDSPVCLADNSSGYVSPALWRLNRRCCSWTSPAQLWIRFLPAKLKS